MHHPNANSYRLEPAPQTQQQIARDKIYAEVRSVSDQLQRLTKRLSNVSAWVATLSLPDDDRRHEGED
jgi:hypothetical protein